MIWMSRIITESSKFGESEEEAGATQGTMVEEAGSAFALHDATSRVLERFSAQVSAVGSPGRVSKPGTAAAAGPSEERSHRRKRSFRPWDFDAFTTRIGSFSAMNWFAKAKEVDAVACAAFGWSNAGPELLKCECCGVQLDFSEHEDQTRKANSGESISRERDVVKEFRGLIETKHMRECPWRKSWATEEEARELISRFRNQGAEMELLDNNDNASNESPDDFFFDADHVRTQIRQKLDAMVGWQF